jgi:hypothetical protein
MKTREAPAELLTEEELAAAESGEQPGNGEVTAELTAKSEDTSETPEIQDED